MEEDLFDFRDNDIQYQDAKRFEDEARQEELERHQED